MPTIKDWSDETIAREALAWLRERFEIPEARWRRGHLHDGAECPMASVLWEAGYEDVWVGYTVISYSQDGETKKVKVPYRVSLFARWFDKGVFPELVVPYLEAA